MSQSLANFTLQSTLLLSSGLCFLLCPTSFTALILSLEGHEIPRIGLGVYKNTGPECVEAVSAALKVGYR